MITLGEYRLFDLIEKKWIKAGKPEGVFSVRFDDASKEERRILSALRSIWENKKLNRLNSEFLIVPEEYNRKAIYEYGYRPTYGFMTDGACLPYSMRIEFVKLIVEQKGV